MLQQESVRTARGTVRRFDSWSSVRCPSSRAAAVTPAETPEAGTRVEGHQQAGQVREDPPTASRDLKALRPILTLTPVSSGQSWMGVPECGGTFVAVINSP